MSLSLFGRQDPLSNLGRFMFEDFASPGMGVGTLLQQDPLQQVTGRSRTSIGAIDIQETDKQWLIDVDTPGMKESDIVVNTDGNVLNISGERQSERKEEGTDYNYYERSVGKFNRSFTLSDNAETGKMSAKLSNGVLHIQVPKKKVITPKVRNIPIEYSGQ